LLQEVAGYTTERNHVYQGQANVECCVAMDYLNLSCYGSWSFHFSQNIFKSITRNETDRPVPTNLSADLAKLHIFHPIQTP
jgi:hypothetical protein